MNEKEKQHPEAIRARRLAELVRYSRGFTPGSLVLKDGLIAYARRTFGVSKRTARDYAEAVLIQLGEQDAWIPSKVKPEDDK